MILQIQRMDESSKKQLINIKLDINYIPIAISKKDNKSILIKTFKNIVPESTYIIKWN